jgi:hypothetical protein
VLIGICGKAGAGKDTVADIVTELLSGSIKKSWATPVKEMLYAINPIVEGNKRVRDFVDAAGWDSAKRHPEIRALLQRVGTEGGRGVLGEMVWINHLLDQYYDERDVVHYVVPDTRFPNEATHCDVLIKVIRPDAPSLGSNANHASEQDIGTILDSNWVINTGTIADMSIMVQAILRREGLL